MNILFVPIKSILLFNKTGKIEILLCDILFLINTKNGCKITDIHKKEYTSPKSIKQLKKLFRGNGFLIISRSILINMNHIATQVDKIFNSKIIKLIGDFNFDVYAPLAKKVKKLFDLKRIKNWLDYRKLKRRY
jgi:DNA-binding LytR/AlgR family response regulator